MYWRPVHGVTGRGNTNTLRRQAVLVGSTYALRWLSVVNDETRDRLPAIDDGVKVPGRLYGDLLGFTETHGLPRMIPR